MRLLKRLALVVDERRPEFVRLAAIRSVQRMLPDTNPLRSEAPESLLDRTLRPWDNRLYRENGRGILRRVTIPPASLMDVWS